MTRKAIVYTAARVSFRSYWQVFWPTQDRLTFTLSDAEIWVQGHEVYKISVLYNFIIDLFEVPDLDPKVKE